MENIYSLLSDMGFPSCSQEDCVDIIKSLPPEIATLILGKLDGKSLFAACRVSWAWWRLCMTDGQLRAKIHSHLREERRRRLRRQVIEHRTFMRSLYSMWPAEKKSKKSRARRNCETVENVT